MDWMPAIIELGNENIIIIALIVWLVSFALTVFITVNKINKNHTLKIEEIRNKSDERNHKETIALIKGDKELLEMITKSLSKQYTEQIEELKKTIDDLNNRYKSLVEKYNEHRKALIRSHEEEQQQLLKQNKQLMAEVVCWRNRYEEEHQELVAMRQAFENAISQLRTLLKGAKMDDHAKEELESIFQDFISELEKHGEVSK